VARTRRVEYEAFFPSATKSDVLPGAKQIPIDVIDQNPQQPRQGPLEGIEDLAASIAEYGLLQPIVVAPALGGRHTCIAGHRRLAAYRWLADHHPERDRWAAIPAIERDGHVDEWLALALLENMSRADLTEPEIITGLRLLHDLQGWSQSQIAAKLGVSRQRVSQYFRVAGDAEVAELVQTGQVSVAKAYDVLLASSPATKQEALVVARQGAPQRVIRQVAKGGPKTRAASVRQRADTERPDGVVPSYEETATGAVSAGSTGTIAGTGEPLTADEHVDHPQTRGPASGSSTVEEASSRGDGEVWPNTVASGPVATATPAAGARDLADLAGSLGIIIRPEALQLTRLLLSATSTGGRIDAQAFLRLARADIRQVEAAIRAAASEAR
jgi:ParB family transcriptional regulator, chromosome partitioning protein